MRWCGGPDVESCLGILMTDGPWERRNCRRQVNMESRGDEDMGSEPGDV